MTQRTIRYECGESDAGTRLDKLVAKVAGSCSRRRAKELIEEGGAKINDHVERAGYVIVAGDVLTFEEAPARPAARPDVAISSGARDSIRVLFEDESLIVVDKPRAMHSVTLRSDDPPTLADCLAAIAPECLEASEDPREAGLIQRLDFFTSGALVAGKTRSVCDSLRHSLMRGDFQKEYVALVEGKPQFKTREVRTHLISTSKDGRMRVSKSETGDLALTSLKTLGVRTEEGRDLALMRAKAAVGRRHQVRVHLSSVGHPLVGDEFYGAESALSAYKIFNELFSGQPGFFLSACRLSFPHPFQAGIVSVKSQEPLLAPLSEIFGCDPFS